MKKSKQPFSTTLEPLLSSKKVPSIKQTSREYQHIYYKKNRKKALAYQVEYNKRHHKNPNTKQKGIKKTEDQGIPKTCFSLTDLINVPTNVFQNRLKKILSGEMSFTK